MKTFAILNITPDSFSDGGRFLAPEAALAQAETLLAGGADVLDLGGAASNVDAEAVSPTVEIGRLAPVMAALKTKGVSISIDSFSPDVQRWAMRQEVDYLNDIEGFAEPSLYPELAKSPAKLVVMHSVQGRGKATRLAVPPSEIFDRACRFFDARIGALTEAGVARARLILDPGMGFFLSDDSETSFEMLRRISDLKTAFALPVLISVSRKSFLRKITRRAPGEAGPATLAAELFAVLKGADYIRTHDPAALRDGLVVWQALAGTEARA